VKLMATLDTTNKQYKVLNYTHYTPAQLRVVQYIITTQKISTHTGAAQWAVH